MEGWSIVPGAGFSLLADQSPSFVGTDTIANGKSTVSLDPGFAAGVGLRYHYENSRWASEFGWEYRSNDALTTDADGVELPGGNYASNTFFLNGRYAFSEDRRLTPWVGAGVVWVQEVDLDSESTVGETSFSDSGSVGMQLMVGADYELSDQFYVTFELRYSSQAGLELNEEGGQGLVSDIDYQPLTLGIELGIDL